MTVPDRTLALVYACSGSSNVAQLANAIAVRLDRTGLAEMSCIAGVGGGVKPLVRKATSGRRIVAIDGCPLGCCEKALALHGVSADQVVRLHERGLRKRQHVDFTSRRAGCGVRGDPRRDRGVLATGAAAAPAGAAER